ncbi:MAG: hypothetical protein QOF61_2003 [Acidobacteriota bacterium]|nr:hypothetical protein [Acidobacteriota bacterium]
MSLGLSDEQTTQPRTKAEAEAPATLAASQRRAVLPGVLNGVRLLLIALWLGGAFFFSFVVAPTAFRVLPTHELAGVLVTHTIAYVNDSGFVISLILLASSFALKGEYLSRRTKLLEIASLGVVGLACNSGHWISRQMLALRNEMGRPIDHVPADDPLRIAFNSLHGYSVGLMSVAMLAGVVALLLIGRRNRLVRVSSAAKGESL